MLKMVSPRTVLQIVSFLDMLCIGLLMPHLANHALQLGCNQMLLGTIGAIYSGFQLISEPIIGSLSDLKGRKPILFISLIVCGFSYLFLGLTTSIILFFATRCFLGIVKQTQLLIKALAPDYETESNKQAVVFGRLATLSGLSIAIGPVIGGHIMQAFPTQGFSILAVIVWMIYIFNAGLIRTLPETRNENKKNDDQKDVIPQRLLQSFSNGLKETVAQFYRVDWTIYWDVFVFKLIQAIGMGLYFSNYAIFLKTILNAQPMYLGYILAFQGAVSALGTYFIGSINKFYSDDKDFSKRVFHFTLILTISLLGMASAPSISLYVLFIFPFALSSGVSRIVSLEMIVSKGENERRGSVIGVMGTIRSLSGVVTPLLAGFIGQYFGVRYTFYFAAFFTSLGILAGFRIRPKNVILKSKDD